MELEFNFKHLVCNFNAKWMWVAGFMCTHFICGWYLRMGCEWHLLFGRLWLGPKGLGFNTKIFFGLFLEDKIF